MEMDIMSKQFFIDRRSHNGLTFVEYFNQMKLKADTTDFSDLSEEEIITIRNT
jgi:hypothetical protein